MTKSAKTIDEILYGLANQAEWAVKIPGAVEIDRAREETAINEAREALKNALLAEMPEPYRSPHELDPKAFRDPRQDAAAAGEKRMLAKCKEAITRYLTPANLNSRERK